MPQNPAETLRGYLKEELVKRLGEARGALKGRPQPALLRDHLLEKLGHELGQTREHLRTD